MPNLVEVRAPARLHLGMMSFGQPRERSYGGVGVMVDRPGVHLRMRRARRFEARGTDGERAIGFAQACARAWALADAGCEIEVLAAPRSHVGLGSGTQLGLAVAAGMRRLYRDPPETEPRGVPHPAQEPPRPADHEWSFDTRDAIELARLVGRGRRSCVGVYGFSRAGQADGVVGHDAVGLSGAAEQAAFTALPPVPTEVSAELARIAVLEMLPAAVEAKFDEFARAVQRYGRLAGRPFEQSARHLPHAAATERLLELLAELGFPGSAQSSWGPAVMACCESLEAAGQLVEALEGLGLAAHHDILIARFDSEGAALRQMG